MLELAEKFDDLFWLVFTTVVDYTSAAMTIVLVPSLAIGIIAAGAYGTVWIVWRIFGG